MTDIAIAALVVALLMLAGLMLTLLARWRGAIAGRPPRAVITDLEDRTTMDAASGAVRSVQTANLLIEEAALTEIWSPAHLERLARTYWRFLTHVTLGLIRVHYTETGRSVVLLARPLKLLSFHAPEYEMDPSRGLVRWRIARGVLVARRGRNDGGYLQIEVRRSPGEDPAFAHLHVEVEVANFYPAIASGLSMWLYNVTQSRIHVLVTKGFLRSLARLDLAQSRVGRFSTPA
ncbi:MAG: hypothetical protein ABSG95_01035 [Solirubrobacteraceae bacterium]|jgi:hypothetical protein